MKGKVYLIGAGPGDVGLLTVKGFNCLKKADVVIYDFHLNTHLLNYIKKDTELIYAGKRGGYHEMSQQQINKLIIEKAKEGKIVCRLKGGDPFVFGRGGEEAEALAEEGIEFEIIPGVSSAISVPAYAGIPLTHRNYSSSFVVVPGSEATSKKCKINWKALSNMKGTIVFLMAVKKIQDVSKRLIQEGKDPTTPVAVIRWGSRAEQKTVVSTLKDIIDIIKDINIKPPAVVVIGDVVRLREKLKWYEKKPLFGQRILVTRDTLEGFDKLEELGAEVFLFPTIKIAPPDNWDELDYCISHINSYDWIVFSSANGVRFFFKRFFYLGRDIRELVGIKLCAIGPKTSAELRKFGLKVDLVPKVFRAEGLLEAFGSKEKLKGIKILMPTTENARKIFPNMVKSCGGIIDLPLTYKTLKPEVSGKRIKHILKEGKITIATFTSGKAFINFYDILSDKVVNLLKNVTISALGPVTAKIIEKKGFKVDIIPKEATIEAMVDAIVNYLLK